MRISDWSSDVCSSDLRDLEEMLAERGISVDHTTIYRWVQCYAPEMEKRLRWFWRRGFDPSWRLDETYVKVRGKWTYLYRAVDKRGDTIDFYLSPTRSAKAAKRFLGKALRGLKHWAKPATLTTDKAPSYGAAITELKREGKLDRATAHRQVRSEEHTSELQSLMRISYALYCLKKQNNNT